MRGGVSANAKVMYAMPKSVMWKELTAADLREKAEAGAIVLMPVASMEQHGPHLPSASTPT